MIFIALKCDIAIENLIIIIYNQNIEKHLERSGKFMEVLQSNTADNIYFWIEDKEQGNVQSDNTNRTVRMKFILSATVNGVCI